MAIEYRRFRVQRMCAVCKHAEWRGFFRRRVDCILHGIKRIPPYCICIDFRKDKERLSIWKERASNIRKILKEAYNKKFNSEE